MSAAEMAAALETLRDQCRVLEEQFGSQMRAAKEEMSTLKNEVRCSADEW